MSTGIALDGVAPRSNGSKAGESFIAAWNASIRESRILAQKRRDMLSEHGVHVIAHRDGWFKQTGKRSATINFIDKGSVRFPDGTLVGIGCIEFDNPKEPSISIWKVTGATKWRFGDHYTHSLEYDREVLWQE